MKINELTNKTLPEVRFPDSEGMWKRQSLDELFEYRPTNSLSRDDLNYLCGDTQNIHYGDIHTSFRSSFDATRESVPSINCGISTAKLKEADYCRVGDVVMADASEDYSDIGKSIEIINLDNKWTVAGLHTILLRPKMDSFVTGFLAPLFQSWKVRLQIMTYAQGTKVLGIPKNWLSRIELDYPKEIEQQKIAGFFFFFDERIAQLEKKKELLLKYKKGVMQQIFSQKIRFKAPSGNSFSDWEEKRLRDVCQINPKTGNLPEEFIYIDLESVECGSLNKETTILRGDAPSRAQRVLKRGDILFQTVRPYQSNNLIFDREGNYVASTGYAQIRAKGDKNFLFQALLSFSFLKDVIRRSTGSNYPAINSEDLADIKLAIPSLPEQKRIGDLLSSIDGKLESIGRQIEKTKTFKKGLLQQMFV